MSFTGVVVIFTMVWWLVFFAVLPFGIRGQAEMREIARGTEPGAPLNPNLKRKAIQTTLISLPITLVIEIMIALGWFGPMFRVG